MPPMPEAFQVRIIFLPSGVWGITLKGLEADVAYRAFLFNPVNGREMEVSPVQPDEAATWRVPIARAPIYQDWVLVLEAIQGA